MKHIRIPRQELARIIKAGVIALVAFSLAGQQPAPQPGQTQAPQTQPGPATVLKPGDVPLFKIGTRLVVINVTVKDKSGKPAEGLKPLDFTVLEDNKPQKISVFEFEKLSTAPEPPPTLALTDQLELPPAPKTTITVEHPNEVTHHDKRMMVFFFDFSSMQIPDQLRSQTAALEFIDKKISKDDLVAVMLYTSAINVRSDFTSDREILTKVVKTLPIGEDSELAGLADTGDDDNEDTGAAFVADETEFNIFNTNNKLAALQDAARMLQSIPEKKELIYFTGGIPKSGIDNQAQLDASVNALKKANTSIFAMDTRGLMADPPGGAASKGASRGSGAFNGSVLNSQRAATNDSQETLVTLSKDTGGKAFLDSNDITLGITNAQQAIESYYILGYYTANTAEDGRYRRIKIKMSNGLTATDYKEGYYGEKNFSRKDAQDKQQQLREALSTGDPITDLPLQMEVDYFRVSPTTYFVPVSVWVPGSVVELAAKGGAKVTQFDFIGAVQDDRHATVQNVQDNVKVVLDQENAAKTGRKSFEYNAGFTLDPGKYTIKFVVRENITGKIGTFEKRFTVPDLSADTSGLKMSTVIWSSQRENIKAAVGVAEKITKKDQVANPLIDGDEKMLPNITKVFRRNQNLYVSFDVYDSRPDPQDTKSRRVKVTMSFFNEKGAKAFEFDPVDGTQLATTRPEAVPVKFQVPLKDVAPGRYRAQIYVVDEVGRKFAFPSAQLAIVP